MVTRKEFLVQVVQLASGGVLLTLGGCGGGGGGGSGYSASPAPSPSPSPSPSPGQSCGSTGTAIVGNHGHVLTIPAADLNSAVNMTYNIQGTADHNHTVTFTPAQLAQLKAGTAVTVTSTTIQAHSHDVTTNCV